MARAPRIAFVAAALVVVAEANLRRSEPSHEASAIGALRAIVSGQLAYRTANGGYAPSLAALAAACRNGQLGFVSPDLTRDPTIRQGYEIRLQAEPAARPGPADCNGVRTASGFFATAKPIQQSESASRAFAVDKSGVIWSDTSGVPPQPPFKETRTTKRLGADQGR
jgi:hypothetical protein